MSPAPDRGPARAPAGLAAAIGAVGLLGYAFGALFRGDVPIVLGHLHLGACVLELALALPILRRRRAAWAYLISLEGTTVLANLLGLAQTLHAGTIGATSTVVTAARLALLLILVFDHRKFS